MYFPFFELKKWGKKTAEARRHNCAALPLLQEIRIARVLAVIAPVRFRGHTDRLGASGGHSAVLVPVEEQEERLRHVEHDAQHQKQHAVIGVKRPEDIVQRHVIDHRVGNGDARQG